MSNSEMESLLKNKNERKKNFALYEQCELCESDSQNEFMDLGEKSLNPLISNVSINECSMEIEKDRLSSRSCLQTYYHSNIENYYNDLELWINRIPELDQLDPYSKIEDDNTEASLTIRVATYASFGLNLLLLLGKSVALHSSQSYTIISSLCDSCLDLIAGLIISLTAANSRYTRDDVRKYPIGKGRVSVVGILIFSVLMACCALYIIIQCVMSLVAHECAPKTTPIALRVIKYTIILKLIMAIVYKYLNHPITDTLAEDHRNDVLTNTFGIFMYWGGEKLAWWMDSVGGIILSMFVIISWCGTAIENAKKLIGLSAPDDIVRDITYIAANHCKHIISVERVLVFQVGAQYIAEVHIIVPGNMPTCISHKIAETLQLKIEHYECIERCFVHVDVEDNNPIEHVLDMRIDEV